MEILQVVVGTACLLLIPWLRVCVCVEASGAESALVEKKRPLSLSLSLAAFLPSFLSSLAQGNDGMMGWSMRTTAKSSSTSKGEGTGRAGPSELHLCLSLSFSGRSLVRCITMAIVA